MHNTRKYLPAFRFIIIVGMVLIVALGLGSWRSQSILVFAAELPGEPLSADRYGSGSSIAATQNSTNTFHIFCLF